MKKYIALIFILIGIFACEKPEEGLVATKSVNADIVRFRIYQNQNLFYDALINQEDTIISIEIPVGIELTAIRPEILVSTGATVSPETGAEQDFSSPVEYTVISESGENKKVYEVTVTHSN